MALGNETHKFDYLDNSTNVVPIHNIIWFPIDIFFLLSSYFISKYIDTAVNLHKEGVGLFIFSTADYFLWRVYIQAWTFTNFSHHLCLGISLKNYFVYWYV